MLVQPDPIWHAIGESSGGEVTLILRSGIRVCGTVVDVGPSAVTLRGQKAVDVYGVDGPGEGEPGFTVQDAIVTVRVDEIAVVVN